MFLSQSIHCILAELLTEYLRVLFTRMSHGQSFPHVFFNITYMHGILKQCFTVLWIYVQKILNVRLYARNEYIRWELSLIYDML